MFQDMPGRYRYPTPTIAGMHRTESGHENSRIAKSHWRPAA